MTDDRLKKAMESMNPFKFKWGSGENREKRIARLRELGGSLERDQLAADGFLAGLGDPRSSHGTALNESEPPCESAERKQIKDSQMAKYLYGANEAAQLYEAFAYGDIEKLVEIGLPAVASLTIVLGYIKPMEGTMEALGRILDGCEDQDKIAAFEAEVDSALASDMGPKYVERASESVSKLREKIAAKRAELGAKMGGELLEETVKPPAKKEGAKKKGPLKKKR